MHPHITLTPPPTHIQTHEHTYTYQPTYTPTRTYPPRLAQVGYEMEKKSSVSYVRPNYAAFYPKGATPYIKTSYGQTPLGGYGAIAGLLKKVSFHLSFLKIGECHTLMI